MNHADSGLDRLAVNHKVRKIIDSVRIEDEGIRLKVNPDPAAGGGVIAGELGYTTGKTYTSLSGFFYRGERSYDNFGKLQMVLLARQPRDSGIAFGTSGSPDLGLGV